MSVIIQEYIEGDFSGVVFSMNPQNGHEDEMILELVHGSGEKLVSGQVTPDYFEIKVFGASTYFNSIEGHNSAGLLFDSSINHLNISEQINTSKNQKSGSFDSAFLNSNIKFPFLVKNERREQKIFSTATQRDSFLSELIEHVKAIQSNFGSPQDIEFTIKEGKIYFLQSRPITFFNYAAFDSVWTTADFRDGGVSSAVVSPVMWSLYGNVFKFSLENYFRHLGLLQSFPKEKLKWFRVFYGKPYWNVELVKEVQLQLPGFREDTFDQDLSIPKIYEGKGRESGWGLNKIIKAIPVLLKITSGFKKQEAIATGWLNDFPQIEKKWLQVNWSQLSENEFLSLSKELCTQHFRLESDYFTTIYNASNAKMFFLETLTPLQKKVSELNYTELIKSNENLSVLSPLNSLQNIAAKIRLDETVLKKVISILQEPVDSETIHRRILSLDEDIGLMISLFFETYYYHSTKELDLRVPRWAEDKSFLYSTLKSMLLNPSSNKKSDKKNPSLEKIEKFYRDNWLTRLTTQKKFFKQLNRLKKFLWLREEVRDRSTRLYFFIRRWLVFLNQKFQMDDLFFYLTIEDIFVYIENPEQRSQIKVRAQQTKSYAQGFESFRNPNELGLNLGSFQKSTLAADGNALMGLACSPGIVRGRVRVLKSIQESQSLQLGEIMVVPYTDPGWTPLFGLSAGVITETGGLLSHAALIAREYSIPAVLNIPDATEKLKTGMQIELDGSLGRILILNDV